jgi:hypothetical protein
LAWGGLLGGLESREVLVRSELRLLMNCRLWARGVVNFGLRFTSMYMHDALLVVWLAAVTYTPDAYVTVCMQYHIK